MKIDEIHVGQKVRYMPFGGRPEDGVVTDVRDGMLVMVLYGGDRTSKATYPHDLIAVEEGS